MTNALPSGASQRAGATATIYTIATPSSVATILTDEVGERFHSPLRATYRDSRTRRSPRIRLS